jgi:NADPH-dependent 2,4-dienoyl-CoA reductase/sulfur reductase-like enzyme/rhodanese-related sulfurtransferase
MKRYLIVGGVAGGASTAARLRRNDEEAQIIIFERGEYISYANCGLPYYIGGVIEERDKLFVSSAEFFAKRFRIEVRIRSEVLELDKKNKKITISDKEKGEVYDETYDKLILSPGAKPVPLSIQGSDQSGVFSLRTVEDTDIIKKFIEKERPQRGIVIGAGYIGVEMTENLQGICRVVSLIEMSDRILPFFDFEISSALSRHIKAKGVNIYLREKVIALEKNSEGIRVVLASGRVLEGDIVICAAGVKPDTEWLQESGLELSSNGSILVNEFLQTNDEAIYAVGDAIQATHGILQQKFNAYLAGPASKQGRIAADNISYGNKKKCQALFGTSILKVFDLTAGFTGVSEQQLRNIDRTVLSVMIHSADHAGYYPNALPISLKLLFTPEKGSILGAQIIGYQGVDKRIDIVSAFMQKGGTIQDLIFFEHSYAPPFSSARDPLTLAGQVAENVLNKRFNIISWEDLKSEKYRDVLLVDVRTEEEYQCCTIPNSINIPLDELRRRIEELPRDRNIVLFCRVGLRAYLACRILMQKGYTKVFNLSGGYKTYQFVYCRNRRVDIYAGEKIHSDDQLYEDCKNMSCPYTY